MSKSIIISTLREIKESLGRFLAILAIICLGVGFYAGLKCTGPDMIATMGEYFEDTAFYDYRLISTIGYDEKSVEMLAGTDGAMAAEGMISYDVICNDFEGEAETVKIMSLTEYVNKPVLVSGRMPENETECVVDSLYFGDRFLGSKISLTDDNAEDTLEHINYTEFTIVGRVKSPLYVQYERGNTALGDGVLDTFILVEREVFNDDYFTEVYVKLNDNPVLYSDEAKALNDKYDTIYEEAAKAAADERYERIVSDAEAELKDAEDEFNEKRAEGEQELNDAKAELADGKKKLDESEEELKNAEAELEDGEKQLKAGKRQLDNAKAELDNLRLAIDAGLIAPLMVPAMEMQYEDGIRQYKSGLSQYYKNAALIEEGRAEYEDGLRQFEDGKKEYEDGLKEYEDGLLEFNKEIADAEKKLSDAREEINDIEKPESYCLGRNTNIGYVCFESDSGIVDGIAGVFPVFFFAVAALVCITTMNRMVEEQRTQIGVLKALGYSEAVIMSKYMIYSGVAAVVGAVVGFASGTNIFPMAIWYAYGMMYNVGGFNYVFNVPAAVIGIVVALICSIGTTYLSCRAQLLEMAAELMRPKAPKPGKRIFLEYVPFIWNRLSFLRKVSMRNIFRYKKRFFMMVFGISGCTALLVAGYGVKDSVTNVARVHYDNVELNDMSITLTDPAQSIDALYDMGYSDDDYMLFSQTTADVIMGDSVKSMYVMIFDDNEEPDKFISLHNISGEPLEVPGTGEVIINEKTSKVYGINVGDEIVLRDADMNEMPVKVSGINENYINNYVYISSSTYEAAAGNPAGKKSAYLTVHEGDDLHEVAAALMDSDNIAAVSVNADLIDRVDSMMKSMDIIVLLVIISGAGLAFVVLYNLTNINITERIREIATIKVLGFFKREAEQYVFRENLLLSFIGAVIGLFIGRLLHGFIMDRLIIDMIYFSSTISVKSYIISFGLTLLFAVCVNLFMGPKLDKISMTESLKAVD